MHWVRVVPDFVYFSQKINLAENKGYSSNPCKIEKFNIFLVRIVFL